MPTPKEQKIIDKINHEDPLRAARGILNAMCFGAAFWIIVIIIIKFFGGK